MQSHVEIGKDGRCLIWREHAFSELVIARGCPGLSLEPVLIPAGTNSHLLKFSFEPEQRISWRWPEWSSAVVQLWDSSGHSTTETWRPPRSSQIELNKLGKTTRIEVVLHAGDGSTQGILCNVRAVLPSSDITFQQQGNDLVIRLSTAMATKKVQVVKLEERQSGFRPKGAAISFAGKKLLSLPLQTFPRGRVAVFLQNGSRRQLLRLGHIGGSELDRDVLDKDEWLIIERTLNDLQLSRRPESRAQSSWTNWLDNWTQLSRRRLTLLHETAARQFGLDGIRMGRSLQDYPTGLSRCLIFHQLDCKWPAQSVYISQLEPGDLFAAIGSVFPNLALFLNSQVGLDEKLWAIQRGENLHLGEALAEAAGLGIPGLRRALHLAERRAEAINARKLRYRSVGR